MPSSGFEPMYVPALAPGGSVPSTVLFAFPTFARSASATVFTLFDDESCRRPPKSIDQSACFHAPNPSTAGERTCSTAESGTWSSLYSHSYVGTNAPAPGTALYPVARLHERTICVVCPMDGSNERYGANTGNSPAKPIKLSGLPTGGGSTE